MSSYTNASVKTAAEQFHGADLSTDSLVTMDFFRMIPLHVQPVMPKAKYNVKYGTEIRVAPLSRPMFGNMQATFRSYFIPYRVIFENWNAFITDTVENNTKVTLVPRFDIANFLRDVRVDATFCTNEIAGTDPNTGEFTVRYDFVYPDYSRSAGSQLRGCVLTEKGRRIYQIMLGLGYNLPWAAAVQSDGDVDDLDTLSLLPLMAYGKIICDYYCMPAYSDKINSIQAAINTLSTQWNTIQNWTGSFKLLCDLIVDLHYSDDLFVSAWDRPIGPNSDTQSGSNISIPDISNNSTVQNNRNVVSSNYSGNAQNEPNNGTPYIKSAGTSLSPNNLTQYSLLALQKLSSFLRRNQLAGYRPLDRFLLRYGVKLEAEKLKRCVFVNKQTVPIQVNTVMSNTDTYQQGGQSLGDYAGVAFGKGGSGYSWQSDEFGILIDCAYIMPYVKYFEGVQPQCMQQTRLQFFQPEFDGLGVEAIPAKQLFFSSVNRYQPSAVVPYNDFPLHNETFGFAPRFYGEKTRPWAVVSGDFRCNSRNVGYEQWHLFRFVPTSLLSGVNWKHDQYFTQGSVDSKQYHRCFQITDGMNDPFTVGVHYDVKASLPARDLFDDLILDSDPDAEHQHEININIGGSRHQ